jgi:hypothetical protein
MSETENTKPKPSSHYRNILSTTPKQTLSPESDGTFTSLSGQHSTEFTTEMSDLQVEMSSIEKASSLRVSMQAMDPMVLRRAQSDDGALELPALSGTDLASFALTRSHSRLSIADLNIIGMALIKDAVSAEKPDHRAASAVFSSMAQINSKAAGAKKSGSTDRVRAALEKAASAIEAERRRKRTVVDIPAEPEGEP